MGLMELQFEKFIIGWHWDTNDEYFNFYAYYGYGLFW